MCAKYKPSVCIQVAAVCTKPHNSHLPFDGWTFSHYNYECASGWREAEQEKSDGEQYNKANKH